MSILKLIEIKSDESMFAEREASRGMASSINFMLINFAATVIRNRNRSIPDLDMDAINNIDNFNENISAQAADDENDANREELGYEIQVDPVEQAAALKVIRTHLADNCEDHARKVRAATNPKILLPEPFDMPDTILRTIERQIRVRPKLSEERVKAEAELLGVSPDDIEAAHARQQDQTVSFYTKNAQEILEMIKNLHWTEQDFDAYAAWDWLAPVTKVRLISGADQGMWFARSNQIQRFRNNVDEARANIRLIDLLRNEVLDEKDRLMRIDSFKRSVALALERSSSGVIKFNPRAVIAVESKAKLG